MTTKSRLTVGIVAVAAPLAGLVIAWSSPWLGGLAGFGYLGLFVLSCGLLWASTKSFRSRVNPASAFFAAWSLQFGLLALPLFDYLDQPRLDDIGYIGLALVVAAAGFRVGSRFRRAPAPTAIAPSSADETGPSTGHKTWLGIAILIGLLGIIGQLAILYDASVITGLSLNDRIGDATLVRQLHFENLESQRVGPFAIVEALGAPLSYLALAIFFAAEPRLRKQPWMAALVVGGNVLLVTFNSLFSSGGRLGIVLAIALIILARSLFRNRPIGLGITGKRLIALTLVGVFGWYFSTSFLADRSNGISPERIQAQLRTELQPVAKSVADGNDSIGYLLVSVNYFASPTPTLLRYLHLPERELPGPYFGLYSFYPATHPAVARLAGVAVPTFFEMRIDIFGVQADYGFAGNVWATGLRDLIVDFGRVGALAALFLLTLIAGAVFAAAERSASRLDTKVLASFLVIGSFWFPFLMLTFVGFFFLPVVYLVVMMAIRGRGQERRNVVGRFPTLERRRGATG